MHLLDSNFLLKYFELFRPGIFALSLQLTLVIMRKYFALLICFSATSSNFVSSSMRLSFWDRGERNRIKRVADRYFVDNNVAAAAAAAVSLNL